MTENTFNITSILIATIGPITGALIAASVGYFSVKKQLKDQMQLKLKNTAIALFDEIEYLEEIIRPFAEYYRKYGIDFISERRNNYQADLSQIVFFSENNLTNDIIGFLDDENGAFYRYHEIIPNFDEECFSKISKFYRNITLAQSYFVLYQQGKGNYFLGKSYSHLVVANGISKELNLLLKNKYILKSGSTVKNIRIKT